MPPYVIRQGDTLFKLAHQFGFDAHKVWTDPKNANLRKVRPNPNILSPTDILCIPEQDDEQVSWHDVAAGSTSSFVADVPTVTLTQKFVGDDPTAYVSKAYLVEELDHLTGLSTDGDGIATFSVPVTLEIVTIVFTDTAEAWQLRIGEMDPIDTPIGMFKRLCHLGYLPPDTLFDADVPLSDIGLGVLRTGLRALEVAQTPSANSAADSSPDSAPASGTSTDSAPSDADDCGLDDDGTLDSRTATLLYTAYGC